MAATRAILRIAHHHRLTLPGGVLLALVLITGWLSLSTVPAAAADGWTLPLVPLAPRPTVVHPFDAPTGPYAPGHRGVDLAALPGASVLAAGPGVVVFAGRVAGKGVVSVDHEGGLRTTYEPVVPAVTRGERLTAGAMIGHLELPAGHCLPSACLHWGLRRGSTYLDPMSLLGAVRVRLLPVWSANVPQAAALGEGRSQSPTATSGAPAPPAAASSGPAHSGPADGSPFVPAGVAMVGGLAATMALGRRRVPP